MREWMWMLAPFVAIAVMAHFLGGGSLNGLYHDVGRMVVLVPLSIGVVFAMIWGYRKLRGAASEMQALRRDLGNAQPPPVVTRNERGDF